MAKLINGDPVLHERWAREDLDMEERRRRNLKEDRPPTIPQGARVFVVLMYNEADGAYYNFYYRGKIYHGLQSLFADMPLDTPPSDSLGVKTSEARG